MNQRRNTEVAHIDQASVQWHLAQMLGEVELTPKQRAAAGRILKRNLAEKKDWIVVNYSMETLAFEERHLQLTGSAETADTGQ